MCRLFALASAEAFDPLAWLDALRAAARHDPLLERLAGTPRHGDGWGIAALSAGRLIHYRSPTPIWTDPLLEDIAATLSPPAAIVAHARRASTPPLGVGAAHPYVLHLRDGGLLFVAQNGGVHIGKTLELAGPVASPDNVDSFVYAAALAKYVEGFKELKAALAKLHRELERSEAVRRMANTVALLVKRGLDEWTAEIGVVRHTVDRGLGEYGELYVTERENFLAAISSSLKRAMKENLWLEPLGENAVLTAKPGDFKFERTPL